jgi:DNA-binding transcriptional regulator PaaX
MHSTSVIVAPRAIFDLEWRRDHNAQIIFMYLCSLANNCHAVRTSLDRISADLGILRGQVRYALDRLVKSGLVSKNATQSGTTLTINYDSNSAENDVYNNTLGDDNNGKWGVEEDACD